MSQSTIKPGLVLVLASICLASKSFGQRKSARLILIEMYPSIRKLGAKGFVFELNDGKKDFIPARINVIRFEQLELAKSNPEV